ncbi:oligosaccharide flippase family protein [Aureimonas leprariae]|nr:oligosaccharide flippase family protein [Aureimonas leprariae]
MSAIRKSIAFSMVDRYLSQILLIATTATMSRLLTPAETGLYLTANALILLIDNFRTFGVTIYIVQEKDLTREMVRSAFTIILILSMALGAAVCLTSNFVAAFYGTPELETLLVVSAFGFLGLPISGPIMGLLQRDMAFKAIAGINIASGLAGLVVTITLGFRGFGPVSYVWGFVTASFALSALALVARPVFWIFRPSFACIRQLLSFGAASSLITVSNMAYDFLPRLAFGKLLGFDAVAIYSRAVTVCQLPDRAVVSALHPVVLPALAAHRRAGGSVKEGYLHGLGLIAAVQWPALIMLALLADPVVHVLLGSQWGAVPPLVRLMAIGNMALAPAVLTLPVLVSTGRIRSAVLSSLISLPLSFVIAFAAAFYFGLEAVAASLLVIAPLQTAIAYAFVRAAIGVGWGDLAAVARQSACLALGTALAPLAIVAASPTGFDLGWFQTLAVIAGGALGWLAAVFVIDHPLKRELAGVRVFLQTLPYGDVRLRPLAAWRSR